MPSLRGLPQAHIRGLPVSPGGGLPLGQVAPGTLAEVLAGTAGAQQGRAGQGPPQAGVGAVSRRGSQQQPGGGGGDFDALSLASTEMSERLSHLPHDEGNAAGEFQGHHPPPRVSCW